MIIITVIWYITRPIFPYKISLIDFGDHTTTFTQPFGNLHIKVYYETQISAVSETVFNFIHSLWLWDFSSLGYFPVIDAGSKEATIILLQWRKLYITSSGYFASSAKENLRGWELAKWWWYFWSMHNILHQNKTKASKAAKSKL